MFSKEIFSKRIKEQCLKKNLKQFELGRIIGPSDNAIGDIDENSSIRRA